MIDAEGLEDAIPSWPMLCDLHRLWVRGALTITLARVEMLRAVHMGAFGEAAALQAYLEGFQKGLAELP